MTWKVVTDKTQKILSRSAIRSALDPNLRNLSQDPLKSTNFQMVDPTKANPIASVLSNHDPPEVVSFGNHGENDKPVTNNSESHKFKSVITDENGKARLNEYGEPLQRLGPHPEDLPGRYLHIPHPETGLPTHITIGKLIDDFDSGLQQNKV